MRFPVAPKTLLIGVLSCSTSILGFAPPSLPMGKLASSLNMQVGPEESTVDRTVQRQKSQRQQQPRNAVTSLVVASILAVSAVSPTATTSDLPFQFGVRPAQAAEKVAPVKLAKEEVERIESKKTFELSQQSLKASEKFFADAKKADQQAANAYQAAVKTTETAKKVYVSASDKLSAAKNQKMPSAAIQELSEKAGEKCPLCCVWVCMVCLCCFLLAVGSFLTLFNL